MRSHECVCELTYFLSFFGYKELKLREKDIMFDSYLCE